MPQPSPELEAQLRSWLEAKMRGDRAGIASMLSRDSGVLAIGTDQDEWFEGANEFVRIHTEGGAFEGKIFSIRAHTEGNAAWAAIRATLALEDQRTLPIRLSLVLIDVGEQWLIVQSHASIPSDAAV
jgi:hypothetical protein